MPKLFTKNGLDFYEVSSLLQKSLRRGDITLAAAAVNELVPKYATYTWNRLMTISAEDCAGIITGEIVALYDAYSLIAKAKRDEGKGRIYFAKALVLLCQAQKSRDADELLILVADRMPPEQLAEAVAACDELISEVDAHWDGQIPAYVYDVHTRRGKAAGATKAQFLRDERDALANQTTLFANLDEMINSPTYVEPTYVE